MKRRSIPQITGVALLAVGATLGGPAAAQEFPAKEITVVCPYAAGTGADVDALLAVVNA